MRRRCAAWLLGCLVVGTASGCAHTRTVTATMVDPAPLPLRAFARVWVVGGHLPAEVAIADGLFGHLAEGGNEVRRVDLDALEPARLAGRIPVGTAVLLLGLEWRSTVRSAWTTRPMPMCGPHGCFTDYRSYPYDVPVLSGKLTLTVYDGPSARVLAAVSVHAEDEGRTEDNLRRRVTAQLLDEARALFDPHVANLRVVLLKVDVPPAREALSVIAQGDWAAGRALLEEAAESQEASRLAPHARARLLHNLGLARRFDPVAQQDPETHLGAAEEALREAQRLDPSAERYAKALRELREQRAKVRRHRDQREAASSARAPAAEGAQAIPPPPPSYGP
jgi:hypothetical protein